jgi:Holliday junction resolvasome RuvABC endonuclease subunit
VNNIIGIDPAARKLAIWASSMQGADPVPFYTKLSMEDEQACAMAFRSLSTIFSSEIELWKGLAQQPKLIVYIEKPFVGRGGIQSTLVQVLVHGALLAAAGEFNAELHRVDNMTWKSSLLKNAKADKDEIAQYVKDRDPYLFERCEGNQDLIDALCIYWYGQKNYPLLEKARGLHAKAKAAKKKRP